MEEKQAAKPTPTTPSFVLNDWLKTPGWTRDGSTLTHQGGDFVLAPGELTAANVQFTVILLRGKRIEWVAGFRDAKNYYLFQMDDTNFTRTEVADGRHLKTFKVPHGAKRDAYNSFSIDISAKGISHGILRDGKWVALDNWLPSSGTAAGQFGFHIPGRDQIALSDFHLVPK